MELNSFAVQFLFYPKSLPSHSCNHLSQIPLVEIRELGLIALEQFDISILGNKQYI